MLDFFKDIFQPQKTDERTPAQTNDKKLQIATCALFLEIAWADDVFSEEERSKIVEVMKKTFDLDEESVENLIELSRERINKSVSLYEFTDVINKEFSQEDKYDIIKNLWRLIYVDEELNQYEDHFIRKISGNLNISHNQMISAKIAVKKEYGL